MCIRDRYTKLKFYKTMVNDFIVCMRKLVVGGKARKELEYLLGRLNVMILTFGQIEIFYSGEELGNQRYHARYINTPEEMETICGEKVHGTNSDSSIKACLEHSARMEKKCWKVSEESER